MCGIFGFALRKPMSMGMVSEVLRRLEVHQYPGESKPVGGYGAGLAVMEYDGKVVWEKVGFAGDSPAEHLSKIVKVSEASMLIGHVRMPSPEFISTARFRETAQPYVIERDGFALASVHNGKIENYVKLRSGVRGGHVFESERIGLIDSEVVPHVFSDYLAESQDADAALYRLLGVLEGSAAIALLQVGQEERFLHFVHKGKTRGLTLWVNSSGEVVFCSRKESLLEVFGDLLRQGEFREKVSIAWREDAGLKLSCCLPMM
jgi:glucosamine 6-phosphate synthetase-like amidotransferase/phosphosugar isomerase protein